MSRLLALGLLCLTATACASPLQARLETLQNPQYPGDATRDLVPYQARNRDASDCVWGTLRTILDGGADAAISAGTPTDAISDDLVLACMAARGWQ